MLPLSPHTASMGILQAPEAFSRFKLNRFDPGPALAPFVKHHWIVEWNLAENESYLQDVIPNPCVNLVAESAGSAVYGVSSGKFTKTLSGRGLAYGVKFRPGGFYPYIMKPLSELTDRAISFEEAFGTKDAETRLTEAVRSGTTSDALIQISEAILLSRLPGPDAAVDQLSEIIDLVQNRRDIAGVEQLAREFGIGMRTLQRLFGKYVGVSPKWVIQLYRLHNAADMLDRGYDGSWAELGAELGFYDQSHFIRTFKSIIGKTPEDYAGGGAQAVDPPAGMRYS